MQRIIAVLENNIKQWSFIESQLLEPNVNIGMVNFNTSLSTSLHSYTNKPFSFSA